MQRAQQRINNVSKYWKNKKNSSKTKTSKKKVQRKQREVKLKSKTTKISMRRRKRDERKRKLNRLLRMPTRLNKRNNNRSRKRGKMTKSMIPKNRFTLTTQIFLEFMRMVGGMFCCLLRIDLLAGMHYSIIST